MGNFRSKAAEIKATAEAERGNFEPPEAPKRVYRYWLENSDSNRAKDIRNDSRRENMCHFWRVVAIWAPLMYFRKWAVRNVPTPAGLTGIGLVLLGALIWGCFASTQFAIGFGIVAGIFLGIAALVAGAVWLSENLSPSTVKVFEKALFVLFILWALTVAGILLAIGFQAVGLMLLVYIVAVVGGLAALFFSIGFTIDYLAGRRALKKQQHREWVHSLNDDEYNEYVEQQSAAREPGRVAKFFSGVVDFLILIGQVVRVKKWKICPFVTVK